MAHYPHENEIWSLLPGKILDIPDGPNLGRMSCSMFTHRGERIRLDSPVRIHDVDQSDHRVFVSECNKFNGKGYWIPIIALWEHFTPPANAMDDYPWPPPQIPVPVEKPVEKTSPVTDTRWDAVNEDWLPG